MSVVDDQALMSNEVHKCVEKLLEELSVEEYKINVSPGATRGDNYLGVVAKVKVEGKHKNGEKAVLNLIVKSAPQQEVFRSVEPIRLAYNREVYMYSKVLPEFVKLQNEKGITKPFKSFAKYYKATMDDCNEALIMENMKELGYDLFDRHKPMEYNHVLLVVKEYGKLHALSYAMRDQKPELFQELSANTQETYFNNTKMSDSYLNALHEYCDRALSSLDAAEDQIAYAKLKNFRETMFEQAKQAVQSEPAGKYAVIGHGDSWMNNMLFKYGDTKNPGLPTNLCFIDWQLTRLGSPALDLAYFIFTCTDKQLRDQYYDHLIQEYYNSLSELLRELGSDPEKLLPFTVLQEHLKKFCVYGLYMAIMLIYLMSSDSEEIPDVHNATDEEDLMTKFNFSSKNVEKYKERIRGVILDFVKFNYEF